MTSLKLNSLWGDEFTIEDSKKKTSEIVEQVNAPKEVNFKKILDSKKLTIPEKVDIIDKEVHRVLGTFIDDTIVIRDKEELIKYIDKAIQNDVIAIDTETNNSLDYINCKLMGACIYTPSMKQAYIPINHKDFYTDELLEHQLNEKDIEEQFNRLIVSKTKIIMHNGKFDYQVLKCTCNLELPIYWDTMICACLIDEVSSHKLKDLYVKLIDKSQEKYSIESLFGSIPYEYLPPETFAPYSAGDAYETYRLYLWQVEEMSKEENSKVFKLFRDVEMPVVTVTAEMELNGICIDIEYAHRLNEKYKKILEDKRKELQDEIEKYRDKINEWKASADANQLVGNKTKASQLEDPINYDSPTQLAIFLYDILKIESVDKSKSRGTGEDILEQINIPFCKMLIDYKHTSKIVSAFTEALPQNVNKKTGRIHCQFNQYGAKTGRFSSSNPNLQQVPSHLKDVRMMFVADTTYEDISVNDNQVILNIFDEVELQDGTWIKADKLSIGQVLFNDYTITEIDIMNKEITLTLKRF